MAWFGLFRFWSRAAVTMPAGPRTVCPQLRTRRCSAAKWRRVPFPEVESTRRPLVSSTRVLWCEGWGGEFVGAPHQNLPFDLILERQHGAAVQQSASGSSTLGRSTVGCASNTARCSRWNAGRERLRGGSCSADRKRLNGLNRSRWNGMHRRMDRRVRRMIFGRRAECLRQAVQGRPGETETTAPYARRAIFEARQNPSSLAQASSTICAMTNPDEGAAKLDDRFHETAQLPALDIGPKNALISKAAYDSNFGSARLVDARRALSG